MNLHVDSLTVDSRDPSKLARFWMNVLGWELIDEDDEETAIGPPGEGGDGRAVPVLLFGRNADEKKVKNRLHLDLRPANQQEEVDRVLSLGATRTSIGQRGDESWEVLAASRRQRVLHPGGATRRLTKAALMASSAANTTSFTFAIFRVGMMPRAS